MTKPPLALNMIVKNEADKIERCLASALPFVKAVAILDTGSTDDTIRLARDICNEHGVPFTTMTVPFESFSQSRNAAFQLVRVFARNQWGCQFALLMDADMELSVHDLTDLLNMDANAASYDMMQKSGPISYANRRIVNLNVDKALYVGSTHEYIDVPAAGMIKGAYFIDHADGSNRADKYPRDEALLLADLHKDPKNARAMYYLANTYRDWDRPMLAIGWYEKRIAAGGWDEEVHSAKMNLAGCYKSMNQPEKYVTTMMEAYSYRPQRAEPLYDLAKHYREAGHPALALTFAKAGLAKPRPDDLLFVNDFVYSHGLRYEFSVVGFYDEAERPRAFDVTNDLALDASCPTNERLSARANLYWYTRPLVDWCPSFKATKLDYVDVHGYQSLNPSVSVFEDTITCNLRLVNYKINEHGAYDILDGGEAIRTRNVLLDLDPGSLQTIGPPNEILWQRPKEKWDMVMGLEDIRLWRHHGELRFTATVREMSAAGVCQMGMGTLRQQSVSFSNVEDFQIISDETTYEKNWMPVLDQEWPTFMYRCDVVKKLNPLPETTKYTTPIAVGEISGSSQLVPFRAGYIAVVHEALTGPDGKRTYFHRWAWWDRHLKLRRISAPFVFFDRQIEFCSGLAMHPNQNNFIVSFGVRDAEAWVASVDTHEVGALLWNFHES